MNLELGVGQEINIHSIKSISVQETEKSHTQYYKTLIITTEDNRDIEINLFSKDKKILL
jgi:hypothetical protein|tara:strand:- start:4195 stop:4371 length:177 start_codon:yes stop_codon:yes gene_type:complete